MATLSIGNGNGSKLYSLAENTKKDDSIWQHIDGYLSNKTGPGHLRSLQLLDKICKVVALALKEFGIATYAFFEKAAGTLGAGWTVLTVPRLWEVTRTAVKMDWSGSSLGSSEAVTRNHWQNVHDTADVVEAWSLAGRLFDIFTPVTGWLADIAGLISGLTDTKMTCEDISLTMDCRNALGEAKADEKPNDPNIFLRKRITNTLWHAGIKTIKNIASVASGILGLLGLALGGVLLPAPASLAIGLVSVTSAIGAHFFKETCVEPVIDHYKFAQPSLYAY